MKKALSYLIKAIIYIFTVSLIIVLTMFIIRGGYLQKLKFGYIAVYFFVSLASLIHYKILSLLTNGQWLNGFLKLLSLFVPYIFLTIYCLSVNNELYPLIFPVITIIAFIAIISAYLFKYNSKIIGGVVFILGLVLICLWNALFLKNILRSEDDKVFSSKNVKMNYSNYFVLDTVEKKISLKKLFTEKAVLLDFMYYDCKPCREKLPFLNSLQKELKDQLQVAVIVNGSIDDYQRYKRMVADYAMHKYVKFYYDPDGKFTKSLKINAFPREYIIDADYFIRFISDGFNPDLEDTYVHDRKKIILGLTRQ